jgi:hypothetical protein
MPRWASAAATGRDTPSSANDWDCMGKLLELRFGRRND